jgi:hypothetical protein
MLYQDTRGGGTRGGVTGEPIIARFPGGFAGFEEGPDLRGNRVHRPGIFPSG